MRPRSTLTVGLIACAVTVLSACGTKPAANVPDKATQIQQYTSTIRDPKKPVTDPVHGDETGFWYGAMAGTNGTNANGVAFIHLYKDSVSTVTVNLNIQMAPAGKHYEAYLMSDSAVQPVDIGELRSIVGDVRHSLQFETKQDISALKTIMVKLDENAVAEGTVKVPSTPIK